MPSTHEDINLCLHNRDNGFINNCWYAVNYFLLDKKYLTERTALNKIP